MHWIIRKGFSDAGAQNLLKSLERLGYEYTMIDYIPFEDIPYNLPENLDTKNVIVYGGQGLINYAKDNNWYPGAFTNENFNVTSWLENYGEELLNYDSVVGKIKDIEPTMQHFFIRPLHDSKSISGQLMHLDEFNVWKASILNIPDDCYSTINGDTEMVISSIKQLVAEYRLFVVNSEVVTGSEYKRGDTVAYYEFVPEYVLEYAKKVISMWEPDRAYCLDIAEVFNPEGSSFCKVLEINCINGCGLYAADTMKYAHYLSTIDEK